MLLGLVDLAVTGCIGGVDGEPSDPIALLGSTTAAIPTGTVKPSSSAAVEIRMLAHLKFGLSIPLPFSTAAVYVTTANIEVSIDVEAWVSVIDEQVTFELLALEDAEDKLASAEVPVGRCPQIQL